jgi:SNF2 family DNA or RNA helicase
MPGLESASGTSARGWCSRLSPSSSRSAIIPRSSSRTTPRGRSGKLKRLVEMLEDVIESGECALVFSQFAEMGAILERHLEATFGREVPRRWSRCFRRATQI